VTHQGLRTGIQFILKLLALFLFLTAPSSCSQEQDTSRAAPALGAQSAHAFTVMGADGTGQAHLLTGVAGPDSDLHPDAALSARAALDGLIAGARLTLIEAGPPDRYARTPVQARLPTGEDLAAALVRSGWAIVWPRDGQTADFSALYAAEAEARRVSNGAWADGVFAVFDPDPDRLAQRLDGPVIVQGRVISTGVGRNERLYLNFGLDWRSDFTLSATRSMRASFAESGVPLEGLDGAVVRARGWLHAENGPMIALTHPAQLEIIDAPAARTAP
jgi:hypothetical protein